MNKKRITRRTFLLGALGTLAATIPYLYYEVNHIAVKNYQVPITDLPKEFEGFTILQITDLHSKEFGQNQEELLRIIQHQKFDMVAFTGDLVNKHNPLEEPVLLLIKGIKELAHKPMYFVPGNHEWWSGYHLREALVTLAITILENTSEQLTVGKEHIWILGVDDPYTGRDRLDLAIAPVSDDAPKVLLAHAPNIYPLAMQNKIDLTLVGHTHGGQIRLPLIGALVAPGQGLFPKYDYGRFSDGPTTMIISGGLGESGVPFRFYNPPEIVLIELINKK